MDGQSSQVVIIIIIIIVIECTEYLDNDNNTIQTIQYMIFVARQCALIALESFGVERLQSGHVEGINHYNHHHS